MRKRKIRRIAPSVDAAMRPNMLLPLKSHPRKILANSEATKAPATPNSIVSNHPEGSPLVPGTIAFAIMPATSPIRSVKIHSMLQE